MTIIQYRFDTYISVIKGATGTNMFRHVWASIDGERQDTMQDGWLSCAFFVSSVLAMFGATSRAHSTVASTTEDLLNIGWKKVDTPRSGDVIVWEKMRPTKDDEPMSHIGFYIGNEKAISNSWRARSPIEHDWLFRDSNERKVVAIYRGKHLFPDNEKIID